MFVEVLSCLLAFIVAFSTELLYITWLRKIAISKRQAAIFSSAISISSSASVLLTVSDPIAAAIALAIGHGLGSYWLGINEVALKDVLPSDQP